MNKKNRKNNFIIILGFGNIKISIILLAKVIVLYVKIAIIKIWKLSI